MNVAIIGYGQRGQFYCNTFKEKGVSIVAVCDKDANKLSLAQKELGIAENMLFLDENVFFAKGKLADLIIVSTQDSDHFSHASKAIEIGYNLLLEKPITNSLAECEKLTEIAKMYNRKVFICHVLRYTPFFQLIKQELDSGKYGKVVTTNLTENVAYWHQAHSYVRGNWRNDQTSSPMIVAKCCHDLDIISWLTNDKCAYVSSHGSLSYYKNENAPEGSAEYCYDCKYIDDCPYSAEKIYIKDRAEKGHLGWPCAAVVQEPTVEKLRDALKKGPYGKCVYKCDNNVVDHQVVNMEFENGATAHLTMTAFGESSRVVFVHCEKGEVFGCIDSNIINCNIFGGEKKQINVADYADTTIGHAGGDVLMIADVIDAMNGKTSKSLTSIEQSMQSHIIGFNAELSRLNHGELRKIN